MRHSAIHTYDSFPNFSPNFYLADYSKVSTFFLDTRQTSIRILKSSTREETEMYIIIKDGNGDILEGLDGNDITDIPVTGGKMAFPDNVPLEDKFVIIIVSSNVESF